MSALEAPGLEQFEALAERAYMALPEHFRALCGDLAIRIEEFPFRDVLDEMNAGEFDLLGLFQGIGLAHDAAVAHTGRMPNTVFLYRRAILDYWAERKESLGGIVTHVLIHEIGHHFGLSDDDMAHLEAAAG